MKPPVFEYHRPESLREALELLATLRNVKIYDSAARGKIGHSSKIFVNMVIIIFFGGGAV